MIEINNDPAFEQGYLTQWHCRRCNQEVPNEREYFIDGRRGVLRSTDLVYDAAIVARTSTCRLIIIAVAAALVGGLTVGTVDRIAPLDVATALDAAAMYAIGTLVALFLYGMGAAMLGILVDEKLSSIIQIRAFRGRPRD